ncbi:MAG TPA: hypothetical protein VN608_09865 [Clostridia bacterium]|nr:hypothetical protein [Clostridia bacterium]
MMSRLFVDMDGTLGVFTPVNTFETLYEKSFFANIAPMQNMVEAVRAIITNHPDIEVYCLSAYLADSKYALKEKNAWLNAMLPELDARHRIFVPCGFDKAEYLSYKFAGGVKPTDFLLDDYTRNLIHWAQAGGHGIKLLNGINNTRGTWSADCVSYESNPSRIVSDICSIMSNVQMLGNYVRIAREGLSR